MLWNNIVSTFNITDNKVSILNIDTKLSFNCFMDMDTCIDIKITSFISPVCIERKSDPLHHKNKYIPSLWVNFVQSLANTIYDSLGCETRLYWNVSTLLWVSECCWGNWKLYLGVRKRDLVASFVIWFIKCLWYLILWIAGTLLKSINLNLFYSAINKLLYFCLMSK